MAKQSDVQIIQRRDFGKLPSWAKVELNQLAKRLIVLRDSIAAESPVQWMPPVDVVPAAWYVPYVGSVDGRSAWRHASTGSTPCAQFPAQCSAYPESVLRRLLVHEFCHGFRFVELVAEAVLEGRGGLDLRPKGGESPEEHEEAMHARPEDWFGAADAEEFVRWNDLGVEVEPLFVPFLRRWKEAGLPETTDPQVSFSVRGVLVPPHVVRHALQVRQSRT